MPDHICVVHHLGWFFEWSSQTAHPVSHAMTREEFGAYLHERNRDCALAMQADQQHCPDSHSAAEDSPMLLEMFEPHLHALVERAALSAIALRGDYTGGLPVTG